MLPLWLSLALSLMCLYSVRVCLSCQAINWISVLVGLSHNYACSYMDAISYCEADTIYLLQWAICRLYAYT